MITTDEIKTIKDEITLLKSLAQKEDFDGYTSTVLIDVKPESFEFVMNQITNLLDQI